MAPTTETPGAGLAEFNSWDSRLLLPGPGPGMLRCYCGGLRPCTGMDWGDWRCMACGVAICNDCGATINDGTGECTAYEAMKAEYGR